MGVNILLGIFRVHILQYLFVRVQMGVSDSHRSNFDFFFDFQDLVMFLDYRGVGNVFFRFSLNIFAHYVSMVLIGV